MSARMVPAVATMVDLLRGALHLEMAADGWAERAKRWSTAGRLDVARAATNECLALRASAARLRPPVSTAAAVTTAS